MNYYLRKICLEHKDNFKSSTIKKVDKNFYYFLLKKYKTINNAIDLETDLAYHTLNKKIYSLEIIKDKILEKFPNQKISDKLIRESDFEISIDFINKKFNITIRELCKKYNIPYNEKVHKFVTKEELNKEIFNLIEKFGYVSKPIMEKNSIYGPKIVNRIYGNFSNMYAELNIQRHPSGRSPSNEDLIENFINLYKKYKEITFDLIAKESKYSTTCYKDRFGGINDIKKKLGIKENKKGRPTNCSIAFNKISKFLNEDYCLEKTFDWLKSPVTNYSLKIDAFFPNLNLAVEYDGPQHFRNEKRYYKSSNDFLYRIFLDITKNILCEEHGVKLVRIKYTDKLTNDFLKENFT